MSNVVKLITELMDRDIRVSLNGDKLKVSAPTGALTDDIKQQLQIHKEELLDFLRHSQPYAGKSAIEAVDRSGVLPLSYAQQRLWVLDKIQPNLAAYNMAMAFRIRGALDVAAMQRSFVRIVERHEILRARLYEQNGMPAQRIDPLPDQVLALHDRSDIDAAQRDTFAGQLATQDAQTPFQLMQGPLFRASLTRLADNDYVLLTNMHHIVSDGWSIDVLFREIAGIYANEAMGMPLQLQPLTVQYVDFAAWQRQWLDSEAHRKQLDYWKQQFKGAPSLLKLPTDRPRPPQQTFNGDDYEFRFGTELSAAVKAFCQQHNVTLFSVLLAAYQLVLSRYAQQDDICVAIPSAGRNRRELEGLIGFFVNVLIMRTRIGGNPSVLNFVRGVKATALAGFANEDIPMEKIIEAIDIEWNPAYPPLAQVGFALQNIGSANLNGGDPHTRTQLGNISIEGIGAARKSAKYDMIFFVTEGDDFGGSIEYNTDLYNRATIERLARHVKHVLAQMVQNPNTHLAAISLVSHDELCALLELPADVVERILPLTATHKDLYIAHLVNPDTRVNSLGQTVELHGDVDPEQVRAAAQQLVDHHAILRAHLVAGPAAWTDVAYWIVNRTHAIDFRYVDWSLEFLSDDEVTARIKQRIYQPYDIHDALYHVELIRLDSQRSLLTLVANHIVFDGIALRAFNEQLIHLLDGTLDALPADNLDQFIPQALNGYDSDASLAFWRTQLAQCEPLTLPAVTTPARGVLTSDRIRIDHAMLTALQHWCSINEASLPRLFKGLYGVLINNLARADADFQVRDTLSGRSAEFRTTLGCMHQNAPFVFHQQRLQPGSTLAELLHELYTQPRQLMREHALISLVQLQRIAETGRCGFMYNFYTFETPLRFRGTQAVVTTHPPLEVEGQVQLIVKPVGDLLEIDLHYYDHLFPNLRFLERLVHLARQVVAGAKTIGDLSLLLPDEKTTLAQWNPPGQVFEQFAVHTRFEQMAERFAERIALSCDGAQWSYRELNVRANQIAHALIAKGVQVGDFVGLAMERSLDLMAGILGILKAGAAYVPLDPHFPSERLAFILEDSQAQLLLTHAAAGDVLTNFNGTTLALERDVDFIAAQPTSNASRHVPVDSTIYVLYTSGTTGRPKGCVVTHGNVARLMTATDDDFHFNEHDVWTLFHSYAFDFTVWEMWGALLYGGKLVIVPYLLARSPHEFYDLLLQQHVTVLNQTPSAFSQLIAVDAARNDAPALALRYVIFGGEALDFNALRTWVRRHGLDQPKLVNMYGITETTVHVTRYTLTEKDFEQQGSIVGRPIKDLHVHIVDRHGRPVPIGMPGEMRIAGPGVTRGYLKRDDLTAERFTPNTFIESLPAEQQALYATLYHSGDLARFTANGDIEYLGRIDLQVKIRGHRIELGEIMAQLAALDDVREAVVIVREDEPGDQRLVAYLLPPEGQAETDINSVRSKLKVMLPEYMVPSHFIVLDAWPLTPTGKVDKKALPAPEGETARSTAYVAPRNDIETRLCALWADMLGVEQVGVFDNFFELGGHSLLATRIIGRVRDEFKCEINLRALFEQPTVAALAQQIAGGEAVQAIAKPPIVPVARDARIPLSYAQQRLWIIDQLQPGSPVYNMPTVLRLSGDLDINALEKTFATLVERHESLRTTFDVAQGEPYQIIHATMPFVLPQFEISDDELQLQARATAFALAPFDLKTGPLLKVELWKLASYTAQSDTQYVLAVNMHHIISDGMSVDVMLREFVTLYTAFSRGYGNPLPTLPIQYADFAVWQRSWLQGDALQQQVDYWKQQLLGVPVLELPTDFARSSTQNPAGKQFTFSFNPTLSKQLRELAQAQGATLYQTLLAAFQLLLARYSRQDDIAVGSPIANRTQPELESIIGFFVNTLVMRSFIDPELPFTEYLSRVKQTTLDAYAHQDVSFEKLVEALNVPRELSHTPLFQVMFVLQSAAPAAGNQAVDAGNLRIAPIVEPGDDADCAAKFDITLALADTGDAIGGMLEFRTALYSPQRMHALVRHFEALLTDIVAKPGARLRDYSILTREEIDQQLIGFNAAVSAKLPQPALTPIHTRFEQMAARFGERTAITIGTQSITYRELNARANQVAHALRAQGVATGDYVGLCLERSIELIVGMLGILKAGAAYVPLDAHFPAERLQYILEDSQARLLVTESALVDVLPNYDGNRLLLDADVHNLTNRPSGNLELEVPLASTIYIIYTSGTTGKPKGCLLNHGNVARLFTATNEEFRFNEHDVWTLFHSFAFDFSVWEIWGSLLFGGRLVIVPHAISRAPDEFYQLLVNEGVTVLNQTPSAFSQLVAIDSTHATPAHHKLRYVVFGGEALDFNALRPWVKRYGLDAPKLINMYGITETTVHVTYYPLTQQDFDQGGSIIGVPIRDLHVHLLDAHGQLAPVGVPGEIHVSGPGVSDGYLKRPDLTAERFIDNPLVQYLPAAQRAAHTRLYKSGDLACYLANGDIEYLGRIDLQVKIRGHRIELGEIMAQLASLDDVREAIVVVREDAPGDARLVAYLLKPADRDDIDISHVRNQLKVMLPDYMIPSTFVVMDAWPLTPNGKVDKKALPAPEQSATQAHEYIAPRNDIEAQIAAIWQNLLGIDAVSVNANFFELGGHSLLATQVMSRLREHFDIELPLRTLFEQPSIEQLAAVVASSTAQSLLPPITPVDHAQPLPLSFNQQRLWFIQQMEPASSAYNMPVALRIRGALDANALEQAFRQLIERHAVLRTRFISIDDTPYQQIDSNTHWTLTRKAVSDRSDSALVALAAQLAAQPFDLANGPLLRATLFELDSNDHVLVAVMHHIASDGWSMQLIMRELATLYANATLRAGLPLPALPIQYADFAAWQREHLQDESLDAQLNWWKQQLEGSPRLLNLPTDRPRPPVQTDRGAGLAMQLSPQLSQQVHAFARQHQLTPFMVMLAAYQLLLAKYAGQNDICIGMPIAGRHQRETENLIGFFVNALIIRTRLDDNPRVRTLLSRVKEAVLGAFAHQDVPTETIIEHLNVPRSLAYSPIAQVGFNYLPASQARAQKSVAIGDLSFEAIDPGVVAAKYDMIWSFNDDGEVIRGAVEYRTDLFDERTVAQMSMHYQQLLTALMADTECGVSTLQWLPREALFAALNLDAAQFERIEIATAMQRDLHYDTVLNPENRRDYLGVHVDLPFAIDVAKWQQAVALLHASASALRTRIVTGQQPWLASAYAVVAHADRLQPGFAFHDLRAQPVTDAELMARIDADVYAPYAQDLSALYRCHLYQLRDDHFIATVTAHHAIIDGVGAISGMLMPLLAAYEALVRGETPQFAPDHYGDYYALNHRNIDTEEAIAYWKDAMHGVEPLSAYVEPANAGRNGSYHARVLRVEREHWEAIGHYCKQHRTTPALYLKSLYTILLASTCNAREDFYFHEITLGRPKSHAMVAGLYFEQTPFIVRKNVVSTDSSIFDVFEHVGNARKQMRDGLQLSNGMQNTLLPQSRAHTFFNFYPMPMVFDLLGHKIRSEQHIPEMDNSINFVGRVSDGELDLLLTYTDNVFTDNQFLERIVHLSKQVLSGVTRLGDLTLTFAGEQPNLLDTTHRPRYSVESVQALFENQVAATPEAIAVEQGNGATGADSISYAALNRRANQLAHFLRQRHAVGRGDIVGCCFAPGIELMVAILGAIKAGAAYVPMDANYPQERLAYILSDSNARVLLTESCLDARLPDTDCARVMLDRDGDAIAAMPQTNPPNETALDDLLYVIYTSGSTGRPKGAGVKHRGELNLLAWYVKEFRFNRHDNFLIISAVGFDLTQKNLFAPLVSGGRVVMPQGGYDDQVIRALIESRQISVINCAPSAFYPLVEHASDVAMLNSLRLVLFGGEPIRIEKLLPWLSHSHCMAQVVNMYGPTECTDIATFYRVTEPARFVNQPIPIGKPNDNVQLYIVDACNRLLPPGVPGELLIGGEGVGVGYLGKPELTEKAFINNPFGEGTLYRTGDLVRELPGGNIEFINRIDFQVKLRGLRIELGEIEFALRQLAGVTDALALVRDERLVAYVTTTEEAHSSIATSPWRAQLATYLPDYMVPQVLVPLPRWPLTPNGKIDRHALPAPDAGTTTEYVAPRTATEAVLCDLFAEVLGLERAGIHDDFFALGGQSLIATQLMARIRRRFDIELGLREIFDKHSVVELAAVIDAKLASGQRALPPLLPVDRSQRLPLSYTQHRLWVMDKLAPGSAAYNMPSAFRIRGALDVDALRRAILAVVERQEALRFSFGEEGGEPYLIINDIGNYRIDDLDLRQLAPQERDAAIVRAAQQHSLHGFDLARGPLFVCTLITAASDDHALLINMHHTVSDGLSLSLMLREIGLLYMAFTGNQPAPLPPLTVQYADFAHWQRQWLTQDQLQSQIDYWSRKLHGAPELLNLPTDKPRPPKMSGNGATVEIDLGAGLAQRVTAFARDHSITPFILLLTAFNILLSRYSQQKDICVGIPIAGRNDAQLEPLIGLFLSGLVIRTDLAGNPTALQMLQRVRGGVMEDFAHQDAPIDKVLETLNIARNPAYPPLTQVGFQVLNNEMLRQGGGINTSLLPNLSIEPVGTQHTTARYDITLNIVHNDGVLSAGVEYNTDIFVESTVVDLVRRLGELTHRIISAPHMPIDKIDIVDSRELLLEFNHAHPRYSEIWPLTAMQTDMVIDSMINPHSLQSSHGWCIDVHRPLDLDAWQRCCQQFTDSQRLLRARIVRSTKPYADIAYLGIEPRKQVNVEVIDLATEQVDLDELKREIQARIYRPYDVFNDELVWFAVYRIAADHFIVVCAAHHVLIDGLSLHSMLAQLTAHYNALVAGTSHAFSEDNFAQYVVNERHEIDGTDVRAFWRERLAQAEPLDFTVPAPVPAPAAFTRRNLSIDADCWRSVKQYCRKQRITPALYFKSLFALALNTYCRPDADFVMYEMNAGRSKAFATSLGCYIQQSPVVFGKSIFAPGNSFDDLIEYARNFQKQTRDQRMISIGALLEIVPRGRIGARFNYYHFVEPVDLAGEMHLIEGDPSDPDNNIEFVVSDFGDTATLRLFFHAHLFADFDLLARLVDVSTQIIDRGVTTLGDLQFVSRPAERDLLLRQWNATQADFDLSLCLHQRFELQCVRTPTRLAIADDKVQYSYEELNARANQLARHLQSLGIARGDLVGICLERSADFLVAIIASFKAGAAYVPMDAKYPDDRIAYMRDNSQARVIVSHSELLQKVGTRAGLHVVAIDRDWSRIALQNVKNLFGKCDARDFAYMIYTSGSTGLPKGALIRHDGALNHIEAERAVLGFDAGFSFLQTAPSSSDISVWQFVGPITCGGSVIVLDEVTNAPKLFDLVQRHAINLVELVPVALQLLMEHIRSLPAARRALPSLKWMMATGEAVPVELVNAWLALYPSIAVVNAYGPTEAADDVIQCAIHEPLDSGRRSVPIGKPLPNLQVYILDDAQRLVPPGVPGEICISGVGVGGGYWHNEEKTASAFVANPFLGECSALGATIYRTGDLGRWLTDGSIEYLDRVDNQVKVRGYRIELGEVEAALGNNTDVRECAVVVRDDMPGGAALVGYVVAHAGAAIDSHALRAQLRSRLPDYMVPAAVVTLAQMPLTPAGKIDRKALPAPQLEGRTGEAFVAARNDTEDALCLIWQEVLGVPKVGVHDNFFELGGHSLLAVRLLSRIEQAFGMKIPLATLFSAQTVAQLADILLTSTSGWSPLVPIRVTGEQPPLFIVHAFGGMVMNYDKLAQALPADQPVYGLQAFGFEPGQDAFNNLAAMAAFYREAIVRKQPHGPYYLAGHSFGGIIAHEIARQFEQDGEIVALLALLDSFVPQARAARNLRHDVQLLQLFVENNFGDVDVPWRLLQRLDHDALLDEVIRALGGAVTRDLLEAVLRVSRGFIMMQAQYVSRPANTAITLLRPRGSIANPLLRLGKLVGKDELLGLDRLTQAGVTRVEVDGDHYSMLAEPAVATTAAALAQALQRARAAQGRS